MHPDQWLDRWKQNRIGFHETEINTYLKRYLPRFNLSPGARVFLPLCGKAIDIAWLASQDFEVIGIELSEIAIESFFAEQEMNYQQFQSDRFILRKSGNISLIQGDFFDLESGDLKACKMVYDRAALIAMGSDHRQDYCAHMRAITPKDAQMLLVTLAYQQSRMSGPPFSVDQAEVKQHYAAFYDIEVLEQNEIVDETPRWRDQGLTSLTETVFHLSQTVTE